MSLPVNKISIDVTQHETEESSKIFLGLKSIFPLNYSTEQIEKKFIVDKLTGYHNNTIIRYTCEFHKNKETQEFFLYFIKKILKVVSFYDLIDRISVEGELFIRLNKQDLIFDGSFKLDTSSDVVKIVIKFLFFNKKVDKNQAIIDYIETISQEKL